MGELTQNDNVSAAITLAGVLVVLYVVAGVLHPQLFGMSPDAAPDAAGDNADL